MASVAATLVGLLFVSLSLNREKITGGSNRTLLRLARRRFADFLSVLLFALFFLIPDQRHRALAFEMLVLAVFRLHRLWHQMVSLVRDRQKASAGDFVSEHLLPVVTILGLVTAGYEIDQENILALYYVIVPVLATLMMRASWNVWRLLIMEGK